MSNEELNQISEEYQAALTAFSQAFSSLASQIIKTNEELIETLDLLEKVLLNQWSTSRPKTRPNT